MIDPRRQAFAPYIRDIADRLRLKDWTVVLKDGPPDDADAMASCYCVYGRKRAIIRLADDFLDESPESQRHTVVHELLHCHWDDAYYFGHNRMGNDAEKEAYNRFVEKAIDGLADAIAPLMPLPFFPATETTP